MNPTAVAEYLARLLAKADEDAFHSLIEEGDQSVEAVRAALPASTNEQAKRLIEVLQEIRTERSRAALAEWCGLPYSERWEMAAEGLFYNDPEAARCVLQHLLEEAIQRRENAKAALIEELLSS